MLKQPLVFLSISIAGVAAGPDPAVWDSILREFVSPEARVDYERLQRTAKPRLDQYVSSLGQKWPESMSAGARKAAWINAYNALTIDWILKNYPVESIWRTKHPFREARHTVDSKKVSLDQIETWLRELGDARIHSAVICASRGCPPLRREAYVDARLDQQLDDNTRTWLANPKWNEFVAARNLANVSKIFDWYRKDFEKDGGTIQSFLAKYAPPGSEFVRQNPQIRFKDYDWGLNGASNLGENYSRMNFWWDALRNK